MDGEQMRTDKKSYSKQGQYITGIGGPRAIAVLMVLAYHLQFPFAKTRENTYLVDWYKISEGHEEYFAGDGIHLTYEGCQAYVNGIKEAAAEVYRNQ